MRASIHLDDAPRYIVVIFFSVCLILFLSILLAVLQSILRAPLSALNSDDYGQLWIALKNTAILYGYSAILQTTIAFFGTLVVHKVSPLVKALLIIPYATGVVAPAFSIYVFCSPALGPLRTGPLATEFGARAAIAFLDSWQWAGILLLACFFKLEQIPASQFEQARIEEISRLRTWTLVVWPKIRGIVGLFFVIRALDWLRKVDAVKVLFGEGGPGYVMDTVGLYISRNYFFDSNKESYAALLLLLQMFFMAILLTRILRGNLKGWLDDVE